MPMILFWLLFSGCAVSAWLIGYGMGYLKGARDAVTVDVTNGDFDFDRDGSSEE
jgi:hypothetical protein